MVEEELHNDRDPEPSFFWCVVGWDCRRAAQEVIWQWHCTKIDRPVRGQWRHHLRHEHIIQISSLSSASLCLQLVIFVVIHFAVVLSTRYLVLLNDARCIIMNGFPQHRKLWLLCRFSSHPNQTNKRQSKTENYCLVTRLLNSRVDWDWLVVPVYKWFLRSCS